MPDRLGQIPDQKAFFALLDETAETEIDQRAEALARLQPVGDGYLEEVARLATARKMAEMAVIREMILIDPDNPEAIAQLLG